MRICILFSFFLIFTGKSFSQNLIVDSALVITDKCCTELSKIKYSLFSSLSASYINYHNWQGDDHSALSFLSNVDYRHYKSYVSGWSHDHLVKIELGFLRYTDSVWIKNADQFKVAMQWTEKPGKHLSHSYSFFIQSQMLKSWQFVYHDDSNKKEKELKGWFMAPGAVELAYGLNWYFWEKCRINVAFASCRISTKPRFADYPDIKSENDESLFKSKRLYIKSEYGFSSQLYIRKELYPKVVIWDNQSRFFFNAFNRIGVHVDISNRFAIRFLKYLQFRIDTQLVYNPDFSKKLSYRQELLLGLFYEIKQ